MMSVSSHETLGLLLVRDGLITRPQLYDALRLQRQNNRLLGTCILSLGYIETARLLDILSRQLAIPALPPGSLANASPEAIARVPGDVATRLRVLPYSWDGAMLGVQVRAEVELPTDPDRLRSFVEAYNTYQSYVDRNAKVKLRNAVRKTTVGLNADEIRKDLAGFMKSVQDELAKQPEVVLGERFAVMRFANVNIQFPSDLAQQYQDAKAAELTEEAKLRKRIKELEGQVEELKNRTTN